MTPTPLILIASKGAPMDENTIRIKTGIEISYIAGSTREDIIEIPRAEWDAKTPEERERMLEEVAQELISNSVNAWAYVDENED